MDADAWHFGPLAGAEGTIRAEIVDAHLLFDAQVTMPIRAGTIDFKDTTVEHVGPDSRMGVSRMGLYVDAPNGRSYLFQFPSAPIDGVSYEARSALLGPWVSDRGSLRLQAFVEALPRQPSGTAGLGFTEQARLLFSRTSVSGEVQLGDGRFAAPGVQGEFAGRAEGHNKVTLRSESVGRSLTLDVTSVLMRNVVLGSGPAALRLESVTGRIALRLFAQDGQLRFALNLQGLQIAGPVPER